MAVHRSRYELERVLGRYGASDLAFVEVDANASIQFALQGRYVQLALPLPDPGATRFTHTPTGRPRTVAAQERAYEQALREHWRALLLAVRGKLQSVESGISTFEDEFAGFLVPHVLEERNGRKSKKPRAVNWLLGSSHSLAIALVAAFLVPASAVSAFALPPTIVDHLSAPFHGVINDEAVAGADAHSVALGQSDWIGGESESADDESFVTALGDSSSFEGEASVAETSPSSASPDAPAGELISSEPSSPPSQGGAAATGDSPASENGKPSGGGGAPAGGGSGSSAPPRDRGAPTGSGDSPGAEPAPVDTGESTGGDSGAPTGGGPPDHAANPENPPADPGNKDKAKDNGADNGNGNGAENGNHNGADNGNGNNAATDSGNGANNGNRNGADNGAKAGETGSGTGKGKPSAGQ